MFTTILGIVLIIALWIFAIKLTLKFNKWILKTFLAKVSRRLHPTLYPKREKSVKIKFNRR